METIKKEIAYNSSAKRIYLLGVGGYQDINMYKEIVDDKMFEEYNVLYLSNFSSLVGDEMLCNLGLLRSHLSKTKTNVIVGVCSNHSLVSRMCQETIIVTPSLKDYTLWYQYQKGSRHVKTLLSSRDDLMPFLPESVYCILKVAAAPEYLSKVSRHVITDCVNNNDYYTDRNIAKCNVKVLKKDI